MTGPEAGNTSQGQYEFTPQQDETIAKLARAMRWVSGAMLIIGVLYGVGSIAFFVRGAFEPFTRVAALELALAAAFFISVAIWTRRGSESFRSITTTEGNDIDHLMEALDNLRKKYRLLSVLIKIYLVLIAVVVVAAVVFAISAR